MKLPQLTTSQAQYIYDNYLLCSAPKIALHLCIGKNVVKAFLRRHGLTTPEEVRMKFIHDGPLQNFQEERLQEFIRDYPNRSNKELKNDYGLTIYQVSYLASKYDLKKTKEARSKSAGKVEFSPEQLEFIRANFATMDSYQLSKSLGVTRTLVRTQCYAMGLKKMELEYWTDEQVKFLRDNYKQMGDVEIAEVFKEMYDKGKGWDNKHIEKKRRYLNLKRTSDEKLKIKERNRKAGRWAINHWKIWVDRVTPVGNIRAWNHSSNGRMFLVIKTEAGFVNYLRWLWIQHYGQPSPGMVVKVVPGADHLNPAITIDQLRLVTREDHAREMAEEICTGLTDRYVAGVMSHNDLELRQELLRHPDLIELKRQSLILNRTIHAKSSH